MRPVTVVHKPDPIRRLPQPDHLPARKPPPHSTITAVVPVAPAAEKIVEAVVLLQDDDDVPDWTHRRRSGTFRPSGSIPERHRRKNRNEHENPDQSTRSQPTSAQIRREGGPEEWVVTQSWSIGLGTLLSSAQYALRRRGSVRGIH